MSGLNGLSACACRDGAGVSTGGGPDGRGLHAAPPALRGPGTLPLDLDGSGSGQEEGQQVTTTSTNTRTRAHTLEMVVVL